MSLGTTVLTLLLLFGLGPVAGAQEKTDLRLQLQQGASYTLQYVQTLHVRTERATAAGPVGAEEFTQTNGTGYRFDVLSVGPDGKARVKVTFERVLIKDQGPAGSVDYDSADPPAEVPFAVRIPAALVGKHFTMTISPKGLISDVQGVEEMVSQVVEDLEDVPEPDHSRMVTDVQQQFTNETMLAMMQPLLDVYPEKPVAVGESWERKDSPAPGITVTNVWTFKEAKDGVNILQLNGSFSTNPSGLPPEAGPPPTVRGNAEGTLELSATTGWTLTGSVGRSIVTEQSVRLPTSQEDATFTTIVKSTATLGPVQSE